MKRRIEASIHRIKGEKGDDEPYGGKRSFS